MVNVAACALCTRGEAIKDRTCNHLLSHLFYLNFLRKNLFVFIYLMVVEGRSLKHRFCEMIVKESKVYL